MKSDFADFAGRVALTVALACLAGIGVTVGVLAVPRARAGLELAPAPGSGYALGDRIEVPASIYDGSPYTVILFARSTCGVCQQSKPWLEGLTKALQRQPNVRVVMVGTGAQASDEVGYAAEIGVGRERVFPLAPATIKLSQVPTLVMVDRTGVVRYSHAVTPREDRDQVVEMMLSLIDPS